MWCLTITGRLKDSLRQCKLGLKQTPNFFASVSNFLSFVQSLASAVIMVGGNNEMSIAPQPVSYNLLDSIKLPISKVVAVLAFCNLPREFQDALFNKKE